MKQLCSPVYLLLPLPPILTRGRNSKNMIIPHLCSTASKALSTPTNICYMPNIGDIRRSNVSSNCGNNRPPHLVAGIFVVSTTLKKGRLWQKWVQNPTHAEEIIPPWKMWYITRARDEKQLCLVCEAQRRDIGRARARAKEAGLGVRPVKMTPKNNL